MPILPLALPTGSDKGREAHAGVAQLINCYAEQSNGAQKSQMQVWAGPGLDPIVTLPGSGGVRALLEVDGVGYVVIGRLLYQVTSGGAYTLLGGITSDGYVGMTRNQRAAGTQVTVVCDGIAWFVSGGSLSRITDVDLPGPVDVCTVNGSTIFAIPDGRMFRSEIDDTTSIDGLDVAEARSVADGLYRVVDRGGDLIAIGPRSFEVWQDIGGEAFGFSRTTAVRIGALGPSSVVKASIVTPQTVTDTVVWAAVDQYGKYAGVVMLDGSGVRKVSSLWVDRLIEAEADPLAIVATSWVSRGHGFVSFRLTSTTVVYDTTTGEWHERQSRTTKGAATAWRVSLATVLAGRTLVGDATSPKIYWLDEDTADEDGEEMVLTCRTPIANAFPERMEMDRLHLDVIPGVGLGTGATQDVDPVIAMRWSRDGETWSAERQRALGAQGQRGQRVTWSRIGTHQQITLEFKCSAAVARGLMSARWEGMTLTP